jgi:ribosomal-protein-alanine N-acetyltransferase
MKLYELTDDKILISKATKDDIDSIMDIEKVFGDSAWKNPQSFFKPQYTTFIISNEGMCVGYFMIKKSEVLQGGITLVKMATNKSIQNKGYGGIMLSYLKRMYSKIDLDVRVNNTSAINLYKRNGFKIIETRKQYYKNGDDALYMQT